MACSSDAIENSFRRPDLTNSRNSTVIPLSDHETVKTHMRLTSKIGATIDDPLSSEWEWPRSQIYEKTLEYRLNIGTTKGDDDSDNRLEDEEDEELVPSVSGLHVLAGVGGGAVSQETMNGGGGGTDYGLAPPIRPPKIAVLAVLQNAVKRMSPDPENSGVEVHHRRSKVRDDQMEIMGAYWESFYKFHGRYPVSSAGSPGQESGPGRDHFGQRSPSEESRQSTSSEFDEEKASQGLWSMTSAELRDMHHEMSVKVRELSDVLINLLTDRDQLQLELEARNDFIAATLRLRELIHSQNSRASTGQSRLKRRYSKKLHQEENKLLQMTVPYVPEPMGLDVKTIQLLTKIVEAMSSGSSLLPSRLQEYISESTARRDRTS
eukprot:m.14688 g.14688  ORF g.14688 m.14688 type:complete len:378 (+) comp25891_c0_seq1:158-1291(+)